MRNSNIVLRKAQREDCPLILQFIKGLADYEHMTNQVSATVEVLEEWLFEKKIAEVIFAECDGSEVGFALFFHNYSTFLGKAGIFLEDLFVLPDYRGKGIGRSILTDLARITIERGCGRLEWQCLDWNKPSIDFYTSIGAKSMDEWTVFRLTDEALCNLANAR